MTNFEPKTQTPRQMPRKRPQKLGQNFKNWNFWEKSQNRDFEPKMAQNRDSVCSHCTTVWILNSIHNSYLDFLAILAHFGVWGAESPNLSSKFLKPFLETQTQRPRPPPKMAPKVGTQNRGPGIWLSAQDLKIAGPKIRRDPANCRWDGLFPRSLSGQTPDIQNSKIEFCSKNFSRKFFENFRKFFENFDRVWPGAQKWPQKWPKMTPFLKFLSPKMNPLIKSRFWNRLW